MNNYLVEQFHLHPSMQMQDVIKMCFQATYEVEHLLANLEGARDYFDTEYSQTEAADIPLYERISDDLCRVNMAAWKYYERPKEELFDLFVKTADNRQGSDESFLCLLNEAVETVGKIKVSFSAEEMRAYVNAYLEQGIRAVHHSDEYRENEKPAYRLVSYSLIKKVP